MFFLDLIIGIVLIVYVVMTNMISVNPVVFSVPLSLLGLLLIILHFLKRRLNFRGNRIVNLFISLGLVLFMIIEGAIVIYPKYNKHECDYILVLGAGLTNGRYPSLTLKDRLDSSLDCFRKYNNNAYIVVSGGQGYDEEIPEGQAMCDYLVDMGLDKDRIIIEDKSKNTSENFAFSKLKIEEHSTKNIEDIKVKVVTTDFHAFRSNILAKKNGFKNTTNYSSKTIWYLVPIMYIREALAVIKSVVFD